MRKNEKLELLLHIYQADREELIKRVQQRDSYIIQYIVSVAAVLCGDHLLDIRLLLLLIPVLSLHFKYQTACSYVVHQDLVSHIKIIEKKIQSTCRFEERVFWQHYTDIRRNKGFVRNAKNKKVKAATRKKDKTNRQVGTTVIFHMFSVAAIFFFSCTTEFAVAEKLNRHLGTGAVKGFWKLVIGVLLCVGYFVLNYFCTIRSLKPKDDPASGRLGEQCKVEGIREDG